MNEFIPNEVAVTCPLKFDMVMLKDNKANDGGDQPMDSGDHPMKYGGDAPQVPVEEKRSDAFLHVDIIVKPIYTMLEVMERVDEDSLVTEAMYSLPAVTDPILSPTVESPSIDPIRVLFEQVMAGLARVETRMDDYDRRPSSLHTLRPEPEPPHSRATPRSLEVVLPFTPPFAAVSVAMPPLPTNAPCLSRTEGFLPNPNCAAGSLRPGFDHQQSVWEPPSTSRPQRSSWDLPPTSGSQQAAPWDLHPSSHAQHSSWDLPPTSRAQQAAPWVMPPTSRAPLAWDLPPPSRTHTSWDLPLASRAPTAWDALGPRFSDHQTHGGRSSWDPPGQQHTYWEQHHEPVLDQPLLQRWPAYCHPPSHHGSAAPMPAAQAPAPISLPHGPDIRYGSMKSLADDIDNRESVQSRQIYYDDIVIDQLLHQDPIGKEEELTEVEEFLQVFDEPQFDMDLSNVIAQTKDVSHSSVDVSGSIHGNNDSCTAAGLSLTYRKHDVEHDRVYSTLLSNWIDSFLLKKDREGPIEEVEKSATDAGGRLLELDTSCKCLPKETTESIANAGLKAGDVMSELDVSRISFPKYELAYVLDDVRQLAKVVSVVQEVDCVKQEATSIYLLRCFQKTPPPVLVLCEHETGEDFVVKWSYKADEADWESCK
ncbi:hypothetical protein SASPL_127092 [Salvia splendens]|uniref:Uncharacterized protein n=1 Tax=Salvia splendens TaxID=180675 RepID=A0A8X8XIC3_SALSN|nr:hypothetical protein SASPL_127092 [Salvia splendens]